jgi:hypothetical protein
MRRFLRYLRIAFSATCLIACVLLIALWVRSYWWLDSPIGYRIHSARGKLYVKQTLTCPSGIHDEWIRSWMVSMPLDQEKLVPTGPPGFIIPLWIIIAPMLALIVVPWIHQLRWQFSLRTLLIATTLIALVLAAIVYAVR